MHVAFHPVRIRKQKAVGFAPGKMRHQCSVAFAGGKLRLARFGRRDRRRVREGIPCGFARPREPVAGVRVGRRRYVELPSRPFQRLRRQVRRRFGPQPCDRRQVLFPVHREPADGRRTGEHRLRLVGEPDAPDRLRRTAQARGKRQLPCSKVMPVDQIRIPDPGPEQQLLSNPPGRFEITVLHERLRQGLLGNYQS